MHLKKISTIFFLLGLFLLLTSAAWETNNQYRIDQAFTTYGNAVKSILNYYIDDVSIDTLLKNSIDGMLNSLDPYSVYIHENQIDDIELIQNGDYTGFGFTITMHNRKCIITKIIKDSPAYLANLHIGDVLYSLNQNKITDNSILETKKIKGLNTLVVLRNRFSTLSNKSSIDCSTIIQDTIEIQIKEDIIKVPSITESALLKNNIGYIKIDFFANRCSDEFHKHFNHIQSESNNNLQGLIIDLRSNPGGLMQEAVNIAKFFTNQNEKLLTIKGRYKNSTNEFISNYIPLDTALPLIVLINENSASASEILAGIFQDLDRAVIVGANSFGKGLVQSVFNISTNNVLKLTTSKYYTPSGRTLQKIDFSNHIDTNEKNTTYYTKNKRIVRNKKGIEPDIEYKDEEQEKIISILNNNHFFSTFCNLYYETISTYTSNYYNHANNIDNIYNLFVDYVTDKKNIEIIKEIQELIKIKETFYNKNDNNINKDIDTIITNIRNLLLNNTRTHLQAKKFLEFEYNSRFNINTAPKELFFTTNIIEISNNILLSNDYKSILKIK